MHKITDLNSIGKYYTVIDPNGNIIKMVQVISQTEILNAALGKFTDEFESFSSYLEKSIAVVTGFEANDPYKVLWYATYDEEIILSEVIEYAVINGYDKIILEHLEELEDQ